MTDFFWSTENPDAQDVRTEDGGTVQVFPKDVSVIAAESGNFVWEQGGVRFGNVYTRWDGPDGLWQALIKLPGQKTVTINNFFADAEIPAGVWNAVTDVTFIAGAGAPLQQVLLVDDGATLPDCRNLYLSGVLLSYGGTIGPCLPSVGIVVVTMTNQSAIVISGSKPFVGMNNVANSGLVSYADRASEWGIGSMKADGVSALDIVLGPLGIISPNAASGTGTLVVLMTPDSICNVVQAITTFNLEVEGPAINFTNLGGAPDGVTDNGATLQTAVNKLAGSGVALVMNAVTGETNYLVTTRTSFPSNFHLIGDPNCTITANIVGAPGDPTAAIFLCQSTNNGVNTTVHATNVPGSNQVNLNHQYAAGQQIAIQQAAHTFQLAMYTVVSAVAGGGGFVTTLDRPVQLQFINGDTVTGLGTSIPMNIHIEGKGLTLTGVTTRYVEFTACQRCVVEGLNINTSGGACTDFAISFDVGGYLNTFRDFNISLAGAPNTVGVVLETQESSTIDNCHVDQSGLSGVLMLDCVECTISDSSTTGCPVGLNLNGEDASVGCQRCHAINCNFFGSPSGAGMLFASGAVSCDATNCAANRNATGFDFDGTGTGTAGNRCTSCEASANLLYGFRVRASSGAPTLSNIVASNNGTNGIFAAADCTIQGYTADSSFVPAGASQTSQTALAVGAGVVMLTGARIRDTQASTNFNFNVTGGSLYLSQVDLKIGSGNYGLVTSGTAKAFLSRSVFGPVAGSSGENGIIPNSAGSSITLGESVDLSACANPIVAGTGKIGMSQGGIQWLSTLTTGTETLTQPQAQASAIVSAAALAGDVTINVPASIPGLVYAARNRTSGAHNWSVGVSGGTAITIVQGDAAMLYSDGTNMHRMSADVASP